MKITDEMVEAAKSAYWSEVHHGGGYGDECYRAVLHNGLQAAPQPSNNEIQRYSGIYRDGEGWDIEPTPDGEYVKYADHVADRGILLDHLDSIEVAKAAAETELAHVRAKVEAIRAKHAAKPKHSPLPGPSAAELATPADHSDDLEIDPYKLRSYCQQLLDMLENYDVEVVDEDNDLVEHIKRSVDPSHKCEICNQPFKLDDICATDINAGTCHAACLEGSPVVDLETSEPIRGGKVDTYPYRDIADPPHVVATTAPQPVVSVAASQTLANLAKVVLGSVPGNATEYMGISLDDIRSALAAAPTNEERTYAALETIVAPDNGTEREILTAVLECAKAWTPEARIVGNVRAGDIARAVEAALAAAPQPVVSVKPLEWSKADKPENTWICIAVTGEYVVRYDTKKQYYRLSIPWLSGWLREASLEDAFATAQTKHDARIRSALSAQVQDARSDDDEETYQIGVREGYERAVQEIDRLTGGDGEYRYCTDHDPDRHTPGPAEMIQRIVDRFETLNQLKIAQEDGRDQEWGISSDAALLEEAMRALEPFAKEASQIGAGWANERRMVTLAWSPALTVGDFRNLSAALEKIKARIGEPK
ncbi:hypothetical protein [Allorhizobium ampelinum]|uniref:hypothetical protein n=1 Tax=Allorhizobium ampelinum TaxID=3025782 RepID=UPI000B3FF64B|nr:hypothetical protein [Allorhizobium ampelinum]NTA27422.1 hypothetical protein [Allorhizobium ampelinum]OVE94479.1 hypothetical protein B7W85_13080 [Allorhizobium ampelinum]